MGLFYGREEASGNEQPNCLLTTGGQSLPTRAAANPMLLPKKSVSEQKGSPVPVSKSPSGSTSCHCISAYLLVPGPPSLEVNAPFKV